MKHKRLRVFALLLFSLAISYGVQAQEATNVTGGKASGSGGSVNYSVGQLVFNTHSESVGSVAQGVQQAYEVMVLTAIDDEPGIQLGLSAYPNPTSDYLILKIENNKLNDLTYQLFDNSGRVVLEQSIESNETKLNMKHLVSATYFVRVSEKDKTIKNFKIIKN